MSFSDSLNNAPGDDLNNFDAAGGDDLANFDTADGTTHIPAGWYQCVLVRGELVTTKAGRTAYRLSLDVNDGPHAGHRLWRYFTFAHRAAANRAKNALGLLGLRSSADLRAPMPGSKSITMKVLVAVQTRSDGTPSNDVQRFEVVSVTETPHAIDPTTFADTEGGQP